MCGAEDHIALKKLLEEKYNITKFLDHIFKVLLYLRPLSRISALVSYKNFLAYNIFKNQCEVFEDEMALNV
jgi:hypothetical protein